MSTIFPQFQVFLNKKSLNYLEIDEILSLSIGLRATWNYSQFKRATHKAWVSYKSKLSFEQKVIFQQAIVKLREAFLLKLQTYNSYWINTTVLQEEYKAIKPNVVNWKNRKKVTKEFEIRNLIS